MSRQGTICRSGTLTVHNMPLDGQTSYVTVTAEGPAPPESAAEDAYRRLGQALTRQGMEVLHERVFGSLDACESVLQGRRTALSACGLDGEVPATYVQGRPPWGSGFAGVSILAVRPGRAGSLEVVRDTGGNACGRAWHTRGATFTYLQSMHGRGNDARTEGDREAEACRMFDLADEVLRRHGADYRDVRRTWLYVSDILSWYADLNRARSGRYEKFGLMPKDEAAPCRSLLLPASTGIEGEAPTGAAVTMDLLATSLDPQSGVEVRQLSNPRQKDAFAYGSAFSRGAFIRTPEAGWISFSGTAAIDAAGRSCFPGDFVAQMNMTLDLVATLLAQQGARLTDICNATIFLKKAEFAADCRRVLRRRGLEGLPGVVVVADICRDELLFEMDGTAIVPK